MSLLTKTPLSVDEAPEVQAAWENWQQARDTLEEAKGRVLALKTVVHPEVSATEMEQLEAEAELPEALKAQAQALTEERDTKGHYEHTRQAEITKRSGPLKAKFQAAMREREQVMDEVITVDNEIRAIFDEACQILGSNQKAIPQAGLPLLDKSAGQSHWEFLKQWYREQGIMNA